MGDCDHKRTFAIKYLMIDDIIPTTIKYMYMIDGFISTTIKYLMIDDIIPTNVKYPVVDIVWSLIF